MDRAIKKKIWTPGRIILVVVACAFIFFVTYQLLSRTGKTRLRVDPSRMTISKVENGEFLEYYPFEGTVVPVTSVYLDVETGGMVDEIFAEGGKYIEKGDLILSFSNDSLQRSSIEAETRLLENLNSLKNTQINIAQTKLNRKEELLNLNYQIQELEKKFKRYEVLKKENIAISEEEYEGVRDQLTYMKDKRDLLEERIKQEDLLSDSQLEQANSSIKRTNLSLDLLEKSVKSLEVRAPISGYLSSIDAEIGQSIPSGKRIGQIDLLDNLKIRIKIDQYYISKVAVGTKGRFTLDEQTYEVEVKKIYPEVKDNVFEADMTFIGETPGTIKRGQTLTIQLTFGEPAKSLMLAKGGFYQETGGRWVYLVSEDQKTAYRADVRLGRQNPRYVEILEGLKEGDWVVTSGYDTYNEADELMFSGELNLK
ncbi:MAG: HlyD family efflux transporter periplasmic adaptor subunit [Deltaproteobacteria bacterium]|nr:HlyD family efflux transporter periplasmic adaptor subunit [Deltaproteobacteria bacterium]